VGRTGDKIISDKSTDVSTEDILKHVGDAVTESTRRLVSKLRGRGLKRGVKKSKRRGDKKPKKKPAKRARIIKRDIFS